MKPPAPAGRPFALAATLLLAASVVLLAPGARADTEGGEWLSPAWPLAALAVHTGVTAGTAAAAVLPDETSTAPAVARTTSAAPPRECATPIRALPLARRRTDPGSVAYFTFTLTCGGGIICGRRDVMPVLLSP